MRVLLARIIIILDKYIHRYDPIFYILMPNILLLKAKHVKPDAKHEGLDEIIVRKTESA